MVGLLMRGLYARGRQAEALELFRHTRQALVAGLGIEPGRPLQDLHRRILAGEPDVPAVARPVGGINLLPRDIPDFTGRAADLRWLDTVAASAMYRGLLAGRHAIILLDNAFRPAALLHGVGANGSPRERGHAVSAFPGDRPGFFTRRLGARRSDAVV